MELHRQTIKVVDSLRTLCRTTDVRQSRSPNVAALSIYAKLSCSHVEFQLLSLFYYGSGHVLKFLIVMC